MVVLINKHFSDQTVLYVRRKGSSLIFTGRNMHKISCKQQNTSYLKKNKYLKKIKHDLYKAILKLFINSTKSLSILRKRYHSKRSLFLKWVWGGTT